MTNTNTTTSRGGIGLFGLTFVVLLAIKLVFQPAGLTWLWVFSPLIIGFSLAVLFIVIALIVILLAD